MPKFLVTGGTGFIGSHVVRRLCTQQYDVRVLARSTSSLQNIEGLPIEIVRGDLTDRASLDRAVEGCQVVFHVAADYRLWSRTPKDLYRNNVEGTENLLASSFANGVIRVVYTSTVGTIAFPEDGSGGSEDNFPEPSQLSGHYKRSKFQAEQVALRYANEGHPVVIVNPTAPVGECDSKPTETGKMIVDFLNRKMPAYIDTGLNIVDVGDVAEGHILAMVKGEPGSRYILGGRNMTLKEILDTLSQITGIPAPKVQLPYALAYCAGIADTFLSRITRQPPRIPLEGVKMAKYKMFVNSGKAERELGYRPARIEQALERAIQWFRSHKMAPSR